METSPKNNTEVSGNRRGQVRAPDFRDELIDRQGIADFLRRQHPRETARWVEARTGIPARTAECWLDAGRGVRPSFAHAMQLACAYGPSFLAAALRHAPAWLDDAHRAEEARRIDAEIASLEAEKRRLGGGGCGQGT